jgi:heptose I phosphotransferase
MSNISLVLEDSFIMQYLMQEDMLTNVDRWQYIFNLSGEQYRFVKNRQTIRITLANNNYFLKKHYPLSILDIIKNFIKCAKYSSALDESRAIAAVTQLGINTLEVSAFGMRTGKFGSNSSFIMTKAVEPNLNLDTFCEMLINTKFYYKLKRIIIKHIAQITRKLHLQGLNHRDYYLCHYLLNFTQADVAAIKDSLNDRDIQNSNVTIKMIEQEFIARVYLIDLHRMQIRDKVPTRYIIKDLSALLFSVRSLQFTKFDYIRFLKIYLNCSTKYNLKQFFLHEKRWLTRIVYKAAAMREKG